MHEENVNQNLLWSADILLYSFFHKTRHQKNLKKSNFDVSERADLNHFHNP